LKRWRGARGGAEGVKGKKKREFSPEEASQQ
jgi:hypothetical protein